MAASKIEWTGVTWNPVVGCSKVSSGCTNCYALAMSRRLAGVARKCIREGSNPGRRASYLRVVNKRSDWNGKIVTVPQALVDPVNWRKPRLIFVNSMSDLFHTDVPFKFIGEVFDVALKTPRHTYQILTKRSERLLELNDRLNWPANIWMGVTVEARKHLDRIDHLRRTAAKVKFLSVEPLLTSMGKVNLKGVNWVIVGGESGSGARPMHPEWARSALKNCETAGVPLFFKQHGAWLHESQFKGNEEAAQEARSIKRKNTQKRIHKWPDGTTSYRTGKKATYLDGKQWKEYPVDRASTHY